MGNKKIKIKEVSYDFSNINKSHIRESVVQKRKLTNFGKQLETKTKSKLLNKPGVLYQKLLLTEEGLKLDLNKILSEVLILNEEEVEQENQKNKVGLFKVLYTTELELLKFKEKHKENNQKNNDRLELLLLFQKEMEKLSITIYEFIAVLTYLEKEIKYISTFDKLSEIENKLEKIGSKLEKNVAKYQVLKEKAFDQLKYFQNEKLEIRVLNYQKKYSSENIEEIKSFIENMLIDGDEVSEVKNKYKYREKEKVDKRKEFTEEKDIFNTRKSLASKINISTEDLVEKNKKITSEQERVGNVMLKELDKIHYKDYLIGIDKFKIISYKTMLTPIFDKRKVKTEVEFYRYTLQQRNKKKIYDDTQSKLLKLSNGLDDITKVKDKINEELTEIISLKEILENYNQKQLFPGFYQLLNKIKQTEELLTKTTLEIKESITYTNETLIKGQEKIKRIG